MAPVTDDKYRRRGQRWLLIVLLTILLLNVITATGFEGFAIVTSPSHFLPGFLFRVISRKAQVNVQVKVLVNRTVHTKRLVTAKPDPSKESLRKEAEPTPVQNKTLDEVTSVIKASQARAVKLVGKDNKEVTLDLLHFKSPLRSKVVVLTLSGRSKFSIRQTIRKTWKKHWKNVFFVIGRHGCSIPPQFRRQFECELKSPGSQVPKEAREKHQKYLEKEQEKLKEEFDTYHDVLLVDMVDAYRSLPKKLKLGYSWVLKETTADWVLKADDDFFVRVPRLNEIVKGRKPVRTVLGQIATGWVVPRKGKWAELSYQNKTYPSFPLGSCGHMVSRDVVKYIVTSDQFEYQGEDVSVGIWLHKKPDFPGVKFVSSPAFIGNKNCRERNRIVIGHDMSPQQMEVCSHLGYR